MDDEMRECARCKQVRNRRSMWCGAGRWLCSACYQVGVVSARLLHGGKVEPRQPE